MKKILWIFLTGLILFTAGCDLPTAATVNKGNDTGSAAGVGKGGADDEPTPMPEAAPPENSSFFTPGAGGWTVFETNDIQFAKISYTFWKKTDTAASTSITMDLIKTTGNSNGGYGFFFKGGMVSGKYSMLTVLIKTSGSYAVGKVVGGEYRNILWWTTSSQLNAYPYATNNVKVQEAEGKYELFINSVKVTEFTDTDETKGPPCTGTDSGIVAVVTAAEQFPQTPVKVYYK